MQHKNHHRQKNNKFTKVILHKPDWLLRKERRDLEIARRKAAEETRKERIITRWACSGALAGIICLFVVISAQYGWIAGILGAIFGGLIGYGLGVLAGNIVACSNRRF